MRSVVELGRNTFAIQTDTGSFTARTAALNHVAQFEAVECLGGVKPLRDEFEKVRDVVGCLVVKQGDR